jgi:hypothetical protein
MGLAVPWDIEYCEAEQKRIKPVLVAETEMEQKAAIEAVSYEQLAAKISELEGKPVCVQALWDGDTRGWRISLAVIMSIDGQLKETYLGNISFGTDARLFNGTVPPWPESSYAIEVGEKLASSLGAEFYFPSPKEPNDDQIRWVEKHPLIAPNRASASRSTQKRPWWRIW